MNNGRKKAGPLGCAIVLLIIVAGFVFAAIFESTKVDKSPKTVNNISDFALKTATEATGDRFHSISYDKDTDYLEIYILAPKSDDKENQLNSIYTDCYNIFKAFGLQNEYICDEINISHFYNIDESLALPIDQDKGFEQDNKKYSCITSISIYSENMSTIDWSSITVNDIPRINDKFYNHANYYSGQTLTQRTSVSEEFTKYTGNKSLGLTYKELQQNFRTAAKAASSGTRMSDFEYHEDSKTVGGYKLNDYSFVTVTINDKTEISTILCFGLPKGDDQIENFIKSCVFILQSINKDLSFDDAAEFLLQCQSSENGITYNDYIYQYAVSDQSAGLSINPIDFE